MSTIGERIKKRRELLGITQEEAGKAIDVSKQAVYKYENNIVANIPSDKIEKLAALLRTSPSYLMGWTDCVDLQESQDSPIINRVITTCEKLNLDGQKKVADYADDLCQSGKYSRSQVTSFMSPNNKERTYREAAYDGNLDPDTADERLAIVDGRRKNSKKNKRSAKSNSGF